MPNGPRKKWGEGKVPERCIHCGNNTRVHWTKGLCSQCGTNNEIRGQYPALSGRPINVMVDNETNDASSYSELSPDPFVSPVHGGGVGEDTEEVPSPVGHSGERRPGTLSENEGTAPGDASPVQSALPPRRGLAKLFARKVKAEGSTAPQKPTKEKAPRVAGTGKRQSAAELLADGWGGLGTLLTQNPRHAPTGRMLQFQAPVAGEMLDEAARGSLVDKVVLQKVVKAKGRFDLLGAVFMPPAIVFAIERNPERSNVLIPMLRSSIRSALPLMVPAIKKVNARAAAMEEAAEELFNDDPDYSVWLAAAEAAHIPHGPEDYILSKIFAGWDPPSTVDEPAQTEPQTEGVA